MNVLENIIRLSDNFRQITQRTPVRILRDESGQCSVRGLYPCGEGAGYAGGILSAAADGMRCAEQMIKEL